ncbi:hypothetical protein ACVI1J_001800 [Bradyrhizobium diazoefficiens]
MTMTAFSAKAVMAASSNLWPATRECRHLRGNRRTRLVEGGEGVADTDDPAVRRIVELDHPELDELVLGMLEAGRLGVEQNAGPDFLPERRRGHGRGTKRRSTR